MAGIGGNGNWYPVPGGLLAFFRRVRDKHSRRSGNRRDGNWRGYYSRYGHNCRNLSRYGYFSRDIGGYRYFSCNVGGYGYRGCDQRGDNGQHRNARGDYRDAGRYERRIWGEHRDSFRRSDRSCFCGADGENQLIAWPVPGR